MADTIDPARRSENMRRIRSRGMKPEMTVRKLIHGLGYRYRLHAKDLPGKPDIVFRGRKKVIFVHGCFWHQHADSKCRIARMPQSRQDYWIPKLERNCARDKQNQGKLRRMGWGVLVIWECQTDKPEVLTRRIERFLGPAR